MSDMTITIMRKGRTPDEVMIAVTVDGVERRLFKKLGVGEWEAVEAALKAHFPNIKLGGK